MLERALAMFEGVHGPEDQELLETLELMAKVLKSSGKPEDAKLARARAESIKEKNSHGEDSEDDDRDDDDDSSDDEEGEVDEEED